MQASELREKTAAELRDELLRLRKEQFALRMQRGTEQLPQTHLITNTRRDIARVKTLLREAAAGDVPAPTTDEGEGNDAG